MKMEDTEHFTIRGALNDLKDELSEAGVDYNLVSNTAREKVLRVGNSNITIKRVNGSIEVEIPDSMGQKEESIVKRTISGNSVVPPEETDEMEDGVNENGFHPGTEEAEEPYDMDGGGKEAELMIEVYSDDTVAVVEADGTTNKFPLEVLAFMAPEYYDEDLPIVATRDEIGLSNRDLEELAKALREVREGSGESNK